jgi:hypothetical protein
MPLLSTEYFSRKMVLELPPVFLRIRSFIFLISGWSPPFLSPPFCPCCQLGFSEKGVSGCCCPAEVLPLAGAARSYPRRACRVEMVLPGVDELLSLQWSVCPFCCLGDAAGEVDRCSPCYCLAEVLPLAGAARSCRS